MVGELAEAAGTASEGGLFARALSGQGPGQSQNPGHFEETACLNCSTPLIGPHCHQCGQTAHLHRTLGALGHDIAHGVFHMDGKTWRTIPMLAWKPGELTRRYIHGERAKFVSPIALFLFSIFLMFAVFQAVGFSPPTEINTREAISSSITEVRIKTEAQIAADRKALAALPAGDPARDELEDRIATARVEIEDLKRVEGLELTAATGINSKANLTGIRFIDEGLIRKWQKNPGLMLYKLQTNSYKFSWLLIPLSLPFMWLLFFWRRDVKVYDHAIFVTYSIAFMSLLFVIASLLGYWGLSNGFLVPLVMLVPALHLYRHLRGTYVLSRFGTLWRLMALSFFISVVIVLFLQFLLVLGAF